MAILERKIIDVKGIETAYVEKDSGADMLLLHGGGGCSADDFHLNVGPLSERFPSQRRVARKLPQPLSGYSLLAVHVFASESRLTPPASCEIRSSVTWMQSSLSLPSLVANAYQTATAPRATVNAVPHNSSTYVPPSAVSVRQSCFVSASNWASETAMPAALSAYRSVRSSI